MFPIVLKCCSMVIKTSNAQFAGGALDPDQSATIFVRRLAARQRLAHSRPFNAKTLICPVHSAGTTLLWLGHSATACDAFIREASRIGADVTVLASSAASGNRVQARGNVFQSLSILGNILQSRRSRCAGQAPHPRGLTADA
jgi:hypothetical protein